MIQNFIHACASFLYDDDGATAVEYAVLIGVIVIFAISGVMGTGDAQKAIWEDTSNSLQVIKPD